MKLKRVVVRATVTLKINENWGSDCTLGQVETQARRAATNALQVVLIGTGVALDTESVRVVITIESES